MRSELYDARPSTSAKCKASRSSRECKFCAANHGRRSRIWPEIGPRNSVESVLGLFLVRRREMNLARRPAHRLARNLAHQSKIIFICLVLSTSLAPPWRLESRVELRLMFGDQQPATTFRRLPLGDYRLPYLSIRIVHLFLQLPP